MVVASTVLKFIAVLGVIGLVGYALYKMPAESVEPAISQMANAVGKCGVSYLNNR